MGMGFAPTWLRQVSPPPLLHKTTLNTELNAFGWKTAKVTIKFKIHKLKVSHFHKCYV